MVSTAPVAPMAAPPVLAADLPPVAAPALPERMERNPAPGPEPESVDAPGPAEPMEPETRGTERRKADEEPPPSDLSPRAERPLPTEPDAARAAPEPEPEPPAPEPARAPPEPATDAAPDDATEIWLPPIPSPTPLILEARLPAEPLSEPPSPAPNAAAPSYAAPTPAPITREAPTTTTPPETAAPAEPAAREEVAPVTPLTPEPPPLPTPPEPVVERRVERVIERRSPGAQPAVAEPPRSTADSGPPRTAASLSRIGPLPQRRTLRRIHGRRWG